MLRTALACLCFAALSYAAAHALTHDFQVWTAEGARRLEVALHPVAAPPVALSTSSASLTPSEPAASAQRLDRVLADGRSATIVDFIYTRCTSVCLSLGSSFQQLQQAILAADGSPTHRPVQLLSISFDPAHDKPQTLQRYAAALHADLRIWRFTAPRNTDDLTQLLGAYQVTVIADGLGGFEHNAALLVVNPQGRLVRIFDYAETDTALAYARSIAIGADTQ